MIVHQTARLPSAWQRLRLNAATATNLAIDLVFPHMCWHCKLVDTKCCEDCMRMLELAPLAKSVMHPAQMNCVYATGAHDGVLKAAVQAFKYQGALELADVLAGRLIHMLARESLPIDAILPVPLHTHRQAERGYNQAEILCRIMAAELDMSCEPGLLRRVRNTKQQAHLSPTERESNVKGAFEAVGKVGGRALLLVDDVVTTGATLSDCARALRDKGAAAVFGIVVSEPRRSDVPPRR